MASTSTALKTDAAPSDDRRVVFNWRGNLDIDRLADVIAENIEIYAHNEGLVTLDSNGKLKQISMTDFRELVSRHICGLRVTANGSGGYRREFFTYEFPLLPHPGPRTAEMGLQKWSDSKEPDNKVLTEIYSTKLLGETSQGRVIAGWHRSSSSSTALSLA